MDYCHACRRHLNGALACAGCGTPAEELRQPETIDLGVYEAAASGADQAPVVGHRRARREPPRAARPRRRARKRRGRLVLFGSAGVVLAAGRAGHRAARDRAAARRPRRRHLRTRGGADLAGDVGARARRERGEWAQAAECGARGTGHGKSHPTPGGTRPGPGGTGAGTGAPAPGGSHPATGPTGAPSAPAPTPTGPDGSPLPSTSPQPSTSDSPPAPQPPPPTPTPTQTCNRFLWWCI